MMTRAVPAVMSAVATTLRDIEVVGVVEFPSTMLGEQRVIGRTCAAVCCMAWSRDEAFLAVGACDGSVCVWYAATGLPRAVLQCPLTAHVTRVTLSPDARFVAAAVGTAAAYVCVFDVAALSLLASPALRGAGEQLLWSADGRALKDDQGDL
jgi:WD40 repeat protein